MDERVTMNITDLAIILSMKELTELPNIGKVLSQKLKEVDIKTPGELISVGSENAFIRIKTVDPDACINMLYALEGAIQGIRWHNLTSERKTELTALFNQTCKTQI